MIRKQHKKRIKHPDILLEGYTVRLNYQKPDGFWVTGHEEQVDVPLKPHDLEKQSHAVAEQMARARYPGCKIVSVIYQ
jgi:hypothetical protein